MATKIKQLAISILTAAGYITKQYVLNLHTRQIHDATNANGRCRLQSMTKFVESDDFRFLRNYKTEATNRPNRVCDNCIGDRTTR